MGSLEDSGPGVARLVEALEDGVLVTEGGRVVFANSALGRMLGSAPEEILGRHTRELFCDADGRPVPELVHSDAICLRDAQGALVPAALRRLGERAFLVLDRSRERRLEGEIWRLTQELRRGVEPAERRDPLGGEAPGMIEHEIRTASTVVRGYLRMLIDGKVGELNPTQRGFLKEAGRATYRILALLDDLLEISRPDDPGALRLVCKPARLHSIIRTALGAVRPLFEEREMEIDLDLEEGEVEIFVDPGRLEQVVINLLANAAKFGPEQSVVRIATSRLELDGGEWLCLSVQDQGAGFTEEESERGFQPFVRGQAAARVASGGVGLGLAICNKIVEAHGGTIEAVPSVGCGLVRVLLPLEP
jgi:signal transduction histidine kinase